jgi:hypothetical protein
MRRLQSFQSRVLTPGAVLPDLAFNDFFPSALFHYIRNYTAIVDRFSTKCQIKCPQEICLHALVAGGHDNAVVLAALRNLHADEVLRLVVYLSKWLERYSGERCSFFLGALCLPWG